MKDIDFLDELVVETPPSVLAEVMEHVNNWRSICLDIAKIEEKLAALKKQEVRMSEEVIPTLLSQHGLETLGLENGASVSIKEDIFAGVPKDPKAAKAALTWLSAHGGADLIKDSVEVVDPPKSLITTLDEDGVDYERTQKVNANSLKAWLKAQLGLSKGSIAKMQAAEIAPELGLYRYKKAVIKGLN